MLVFRRKVLQFDFLYQWKGKCMQLIVLKWTMHESEKNSLALEGCYCMHAAHVQTGHKTQNVPHFVTEPPYLVIMDTVEVNNQRCSSSEHLSDEP